MEKLSAKLILLFLVCFMASFTPTNVGKIRVEIIGLKNDNGKVLLNLFKASEAKGFPEDPTQAYKNLMVNIKDQKAYVTFEGVPHGDYAIALVHDENDNRKMDKNFLGIPQEGYAFSNNYRPTIKAPSFKKAAFTLDRSSKTLRLTMIY